MSCLCTQIWIFRPETRGASPCNLFLDSLLGRLWHLRHTRCPIWNTGGKRMFHVKQLYIGGAVMALAEIVTVVIMVATR